LILWFIWILFAFSYLPTAFAKDQPSSSFPNPTFKVFSDFILSTFNPDISLTTTLLILFSLVNNPELLNLYARQTHPVFDNENVTRASGWMKTLAHGLRERLDNDLDEIFKHGQYTESTWAGDFAQKLDKFTVFLGLTPYKPNGVFHRKISSISQKSILPVRLICPPNVTCTTGSCKPYHLSLSTRIRDIPQVQLIEGSLVYEKAYPLTGKCTVCKTRYHPDHEAYTTPNSNRAREVFINSARYLKIGTSLWVDRVFSGAILSGMYHFHASANAYTQFWNASFGNTTIPIKLGRKQIWQAFVQESIRTVGDLTKVDLEADLNIAIDDVSCFIDSLLLLN